MRRKSRDERTKKSQDLASDSETLAVEIKAWVFPLKIEGEIRECESVRPPLVSFGGREGLHPRLIFHRKSESEAAIDAAHGSDRVGCQV